MTDSLDTIQHVKPYVHESLTHKALHFSISEIQSRMLLNDPYALDLEYTRTMMGFLLFLPEPERIAMLGLGGGSLLKFCHRHLPRARIDVAEINPHVIALRDEFHVPPDDQRLRVRCLDGADFVRERPAHFDVLLVDGFDDQGQPGRLSSQRFYDDCRDALRQGAILVVNLHLGHPRHGLHVERMRRSFGGEVLVVNDGQRSNSVVFCCKGSALRAQQSGPIERQYGKAPAPADALRAAFARIAAVLASQCA